jgi:hypothetical protein
MHQISKCLPEHQHYFSPFYCDGLLTILNKLLRSTIAGDRLRQRALKYLKEQHLTIDDGCKNGPYDLVLICTDLFLPKNLRGNKMILVQEGIIGPESIWFSLVKRYKFLPLWLANTAATGLSDAYHSFCVASEGYRDFFVKKGVQAEKMVITGIPNFDNFKQFSDNSFPEKNYVLVCTSPLRENYQYENRVAFIKNAVRKAAGRPLIFKLHPIENVKRATREIRRYAPQAKVFSVGNTEEMIANCDVLITRFSSVAFAGLALGKETYSDFDVEELRHLLPLQNNAAASNIAHVCREFLN